MDTGDTGIQGYWTGIIEEYRRIQANTGEYRRIQENTGEYRSAGLQDYRDTEIKDVDTVIQEYRARYRDTGIQGYGRIQQMGELKINEKNLRIFHSFFIKIEKSEML